MAPPKSPDRTGSRSSSSLSSNFSRSPRPKSKASNRSPQSTRKVLQDIATVVVTTTTTTAAVQSKRLVRKGLDVSPAMLEFFGMKPMTGPNACFQFIEERGEKAYQQGTAQTSTAGSGSGRPIEVAKNRNGKENERNLWEPGPEHFAGAGAEGMGLTDKEAHVDDNESDLGLGAVVCEEETWREEEVTSNLHHPHEPGPEYLLNSEKDAERRTENGEQVPPPIGTFRATAHYPPSPPDDDDAGRDAPKEGGRFEQSSMATSCATNGAITMTAAAGASMDSGSILIKAVQIVNDDSIFLADLLIQDNVIQQLSSNIEAPQGAQIIDGTGKALMPAGIDIHTEFSSPDSVNDFETGSKAALSGGTATIIDVIHPGANETLLAAYDRVNKVAESRSLCNFAFSVVVSEWSDQTKKEMDLLVHDKGINSFIVDVQRDDQLFEIFDYCRSLRVHARIIPENKDISALLEKRLRASSITGAERFLLSRPGMLEADIVNHVSVLGKLTNCPVAVVSLYSSEAADVVLRQRSNMLIPEIPVAVLMEKNNGGNSSLLKASWRGAESSALISCLSSVPLCICVSDDRGMRWNNSSVDTFAHGGLSAAQERMSVLWENGVLTGCIDPMRFVAVTSSNAAKVFNLYPRKGRIAVGADADLVIWELSTKHQHSASNQQSSLFDVSTFRSKPLMTICGGRIAYNNGKFDSGRGKLVELAAHSPYLYCLVEQLERVQLNGSVNGGVMASSDHLHRRENLSSNGRAFPGKSIQPKQFESNYSAGTPSGTRGIRASTKVLNPPGGRSTGFW